VIEICRKVWRREVVEHRGTSYQLPLPADQGTGLGKPLKLINHPRRSAIPVYVAAMGPRNVAVTAEIADGWIPIFFHPDRAREVWGAALDRGLRSRSEELGPLEIVAGGTVAICDAHEAVKLRDAGRAITALYIGGMGAKGKNFYNSVFRQYGYEEEATRIQDLYLAGHKEEAMAAIPQDFLDATALVGDEGWVRDRIEAYRAAGVTQLQIRPEGPDPLRVVEKVKEWAG
jgi:F420-dependent oxidoreductase-like protein